MSELQNGSLVQHVSLGVGKIVALEPEAVHIFFPDSDKRFAAKLRLPAARAMLRTDGLEPNGWLEGLTAFSLDAATGRYALSATWLTHEQAVAQFLAAYPEGFAGETYLAAGKGKDGRAARWRAAGVAWGKKLGKTDAEALLSEGDMEGITARLLDIDKIVAPLHPPSDVGVLKEALADEATARPFLLALLDALSVPSPGRARFDRLFSAARGLPIDPAHQWLVATLFPFVAAPERHVLLRARVTTLGADRLGCDIRYDASPNWATYAALREVEVDFLARLAPLGAKDFIDVEGFLHLTATVRRPVAKVAAEKKTKRIVS